MTHGALRLPGIPEPIAGLAGIATNLWWSWSRDARELFRAIDDVLWHATRHNPIALLQQVDPARLAELAADRAFVERVAAVHADFGRAVARDGVWFTAQHDAPAGPIAYLCAEFAVHNSVPIYSGGLGVLAGDHCKAASDLGVPLVGVGLLYTKGYFDQRLTVDGWQEDSDDPVDPGQTPLVPLLDDRGSPYLVTVPCRDRDVHVGAWRVMVGSVPLYLLDTNLERNQPDDRALSHKLYAGGAEMRLRQEWVLGVGGVRLLARLGIRPVVWHANEGHAAFMVIERLREALAGGAALASAVDGIRRRTVFTTHTPVPAGHDRFARDQVERCVGPYWEAMGLTRDAFFALGHHPAEDGDLFHMTALAIRLSGHVNGVSALHGEETRHLWGALWPGRAQSGVPITHVTNGVHLATWMARQIMDWIDGAVGAGWGARLDDPELWHGLRDADPRGLWDVHLGLKARLIEFIREEVRARWRDRWRDPGLIAAAGTLLSPDALTIGFARRFATYKRADLIFRDPERLRRLLTNPRRPVQIVFAGKAHPADEPAKRLLQQVYRYAQDPAFEGRLTFLEDYEMHLAHRLVQGVDLWLNLPRVPMEACGTSGMKAALNGVPQLGTADGWWAEGYTGRNGWAIPRAADGDADARDGERLYALLESDVVPAYYDRDGGGVPRAWAERMIHALSEAGARFTARRMVQEYVRRFYLPAVRGDAAGDSPTA